MPCNNNNLLEMGTIPVPEHSTLVLLCGGLTATRQLGAVLFCQLC